MNNHEIPFTPSNIALRELLKEKYITKVSTWLLGKDEMSILAQVSDSAWESALTVITLSEVSKILDETNDEQNLKNEISRKSILVGDWLLSKKITDNNFSHWEGVTWDTAVIIHALLIIVSEYKDQLSESKIKEIESVVGRGCKWLYYRFRQWDSDVKYPFGVADVAKLIVTFTKLHEVNKELYAELKIEYKNEIDESDDGCWLPTIVEHLLHSRSKEASVVDNDGEVEEVLTYWWDDYFTTAEVIEGLAVYYHFCHKRESLESSDKKLLDDIRDSLIRSCMYLEKGQKDGMWGSHIDTIKVIYSYVLIRRLVHSNQYTGGIALIEPEIHTVFKALRWMCDEKQRFSDGSFMHTMFLTVFFAAALVEVYRSWVPAQCRIDKIYDDVVWASPVRTTPERIKRLSLEIRNLNLEENIIEKEKTISAITSASKEEKYKRISIIIILSMIIILSPLIVNMGLKVSGISIDIDAANLVWGNLLTYVATTITLSGAVITAVVKRNSILNLFSSNKT